jgi:hypothetical protein
MAEAELVSETLGFYSQLTRFAAQGEFIDIFIRWLKILSGY